jgi:hypothetical protein
MKKDEGRAAATRRGLRPMVTVAALNEFAKIFYLDTRESNGPSVARRGERPGAVSARCRAEEDANYPLPIHLRSGDQTSKR